MDIFNPRNIFILFYFAYYGLRSIDLYFSGFPLSFVDLSDEKLKKDQLTSVLEMAILGLLCFYAGYYARIAKYLESCLPVFRDSRWCSRRSEQIVFGLFLLGVGVSLYLFQKGGGFFYYISSINYVRLEVLSDVGYLKYFVNLLSLAVLIAVVNYYLKKKNLIPLFFLAGISIFLNLIVAHRWAAIQTILYLLIIRNYWYKKLSIKTVSIILVAGIMLNIVYGAYRTYTDISQNDSLQSVMTAAEDLSEDESGLAGLFFSNIWIHFHGTDSLLQTKLQLESEGSFHYGSYFLQDFLVIAVPRFLWPGKPNPSHVKFNNIMRGDDSDHYDPAERAGGIVQTILGEFYWAGGIAGIAIGMFLVGCACKILYLYIRKNIHNPFVMMIFCVSIVQIFTINGAFSITLNKWLYFLVPISLSIVFILKKIKPQRIPGNELIAGLR